MKDGYYLSTYLFGSEAAAIYDIVVRHDQNISLWYKEKEEIKLIHMWELERITGIKKHGGSYFKRQTVVDLINELLKEYDLTLSDINEIIGTPDIDTQVEYSEIPENQDITYHSISHLFSALASDTNIFYNYDVIGLAVDGGSDNVVDKKADYKNLFAGSYSKNGTVTIFPISSPAPLWNFARLRYNLQEGSLMALSSASNSHILYDVEPFLSIYNVKDIEQAFVWFEDMAGRIEALGKADENVLYNGLDPRFSESDNKISMVMKVIQDVSNQIIQKTIEDIVKKYGVNTKETYLAMGGGYTLNCVSNGIMMRKFGFRGFMAPPCVNDGGQSFGNALYYFYRNMDKFNFLLDTSYYGDWDSGLERILHNSEYSSYISNVGEFNAKQVVEDLEDDVIIWFDGRAEIGPRSLGARSLLGDPRSLKAKDRLNEIKERQWWRPVAPIILESDMSKWFKDGYSSPFMLHTFYIQDDKVDMVPAIAHLDNSARVQTLNEKTNPLLYSVVSSFKEKTGVPIICNTSLNGPGEPIINKIEEALSFALQKRIRIVYINGIRLELEGFDKYTEKGPLLREMKKYYDLHEKDKQNFMKQWNPYGVCLEDLQIYYYTSELRDRLDLKKSFDVKILTKAKKMYGSKHIMITE